MSAPVRDALKLEQDAEWEKLRAEYEFMRSFGMGHARAVRRIGLSVDAFNVLARRRGYEPA